MIDVRKHFEVIKDALALDRLAGLSVIDREEKDFLAPALEILETPPNPIGRAVLWLLIAFLTIAFGWAVFGEVDVVASASGKIAPRGQIKVIQPSDLGIVRAIHVHDGEAVKAGAPLIDLDPTMTNAEREQARQALIAAEIDRLRAQALADFSAGKARRKIVWPEGVPEERIAIQESLIAARIAEQQKATSALRSERAQRAADLMMVQAEIDKLAAQLPLIEDQLAGMRKLLAKGFAPRLRVSEVEERQIGVKQDLEIRKAERAKDQAALAAASAALAEKEETFRREALDALTEADAQSRLRAQELAKAEEKHRQTALTAPVDGVVEQLQVHTLGGVVKPADPLMIIVPEGAELVVDAMAANKDVGFLRPGQSVEVKLEAFPFTRYGVVPGRLESVSHDSVKDEKQGLVFPVQVKLSRLWIEVDGRKMLLSPGLSATVEVRTGRRRIIEYLLSPLTRRVKEAGRER